MPKRLSCLLLLFAVIAPLRGQEDGPVKMTPEFPFTFPLAQSGKDVTVEYPVLINPTTVLKPGMVLRTLYILHYNTEGSSDLVLAHKGNIEQSFSRNTLNPDEQAKMPPELAHELEGYRRTIWEVPNNFVLAMAQYPTDAMHLIYLPTQDNRNLADERFSFFEGMFIGLPHGKVTVLAVETGSKAEKAGIKAGDEIVAAGGASTNNDLGTFASVYAAAKKLAKDGEAPNFELTVRSEGKPETHVVDVAMPPTIKSQLMNGF